jgi:Cu/Ag efflux protein CusF
MKKIAAAVAVMMMMAVPGLAAEAPKAESKPGGVLLEAVSFKATVEAIDSKTRKITLKMEDGSKTEFIAGDEVRNFAQIKKGDHVDYSFTQAIAIDVQKSSGAPKMGESTQVERAKLGDKPAGTVETTGYLTA